MRYTVELRVLRRHGEGANPTIAGLGLARLGKVLDQGGIVARAGIRDAAPAGIGAARGQRRDDAGPGGRGPPGWA